MGRDLKPKRSSASALKLVRECEVSFFTLHVRETDAKHSPIPFVHEVVALGGALVKQEHPISAQELEAVDGLRGICHATRQGRRGGGTFEQREEHQQASIGGR